MAHLPTAVVEQAIHTRPFAAAAVVGLDYTVLEVAQAERHTGHPPEGKENPLAGRSHLEEAEAGSIAEVAAAVDSIPGSSVEAVVRKAAVEEDIHPADAAALIYVSVLSLTPATSFGALLAEYVR